MENFSVEYLCSLLSKNEDVDEVSFSRIFMLAALSAFIAPNGRGGVSTRFNQAIIEFISSPDHDWCSFTLKWLMLHIKKYQSNKEQVLVTQIEGCKILPVITYFEFLITSEFKLGHTVPRLPLWSSHIVNSYIALDSISGSARKFGRLARKHISSTIFRGTCQSTELQLPVEIQEYIDKKLQGIMFHSTLHGDCQLKKVSNVIKKYHIDTEMESLATSLISGDKLNGSIDHPSTEDILQQLVEQLPKACTVDDGNWELHLPPIDPQFEESLLPQRDHISVVPSKKLCLTEFIQDTLEGNSSSVDRTVAFHKNEGSLFLLSDQHAREVQTPVETNRCLSVPHKQFKISQHATLSAPAFSKSRGHLWALSLNERLVGKRIQPSFNEVVTSEFPSFELLDTQDRDDKSSSTSKHVQQGDVNAGVYYISGKAIHDPLLQLAMDQYERELLESD